jgi:hypothetical protein
MPGLVDFFISYTSADTAWAEWIGWVLEEKRGRVRLQAWDFVPGSNFVLEMQSAAAAAQRTIAVLSPDYLKSRFAAPEWASAFAQDPDGLSRRLVPVRVRECTLEGILQTIVYIDLVGLDEVSARRRLSDGLGAKRGKPESAPPFLGRLRPTTVVEGLRHFRVRSSRLLVQALPCRHSMSPEFGVQSRISTARASSSKLLRRYGATLKLALMHLKARPRSIPS